MRSFCGEAEGTDGPRARWGGVRTQDGDPYAYVYVRVWRRGEVGRRSRWWGRRRPHPKVDVPMGWCRGRGEVSKDGGKIGRPPWTRPERRVETWRRKECEEKKAKKRRNGEDKEGPVHLFKGIPCHCPKGGSNSTWNVKFEWCHGWCNAYRIGVRWSRCWQQHRP